MVKPGINLYQAIYEYLIKNQQNTIKEKKLEWCLFIAPTKILISF